MKDRKENRGKIHLMWIDLKPHILALPLLLENIYSEEVINKKSGFNVRVVTLTKGKMSFQGRLRPLRPEKLKRLRQ